MIIRHGEPSSLDHAEYGIKCKVLFYNKPDFAIYVQTSADESTPHWTLVGEFTPTSEYTIEEEVDKLIKK
jgi:hypothetical protein